MGKAKPRYCEICGSPIRGGPGHRIRIEGAEVLVCDRCYEKYGGKKPGTFSIMPTGRQPRRTARPASRPKPQPRPYQRSRSLQRRSSRTLRRGFTGQSSARARATRSFHTRSGFL